MKSANDIEAAHVSGVNAQASADAWRGVANVPPMSERSMAQITKDWGAKTDQATADEMHSKTMGFAGGIDGISKGDVSAQETSDEWRGTGKKTAWEKKEDPRVKAYLTN